MKMYEKMGIDPTTEEGLKNKIKRYEFYDGDFRQAYEDWVEGQDDGPDGWYGAYEFAGWLMEEIEVAE